MVTLPLPVELVVESSGEIVGANERVRFLCELVREAAEALVDQVWVERRVEQVRTGSSSFAWQAFRQAFPKAAWPLEDVNASDRTARLAAEVAGRTLRSLAHRLEISRVLIETFVTRDDWFALSEAARREQAAAVWSQLPAGTSSVEVRNLRRRLARHVRRQGALPASAYDLFEPPTLAAAVVPLDAVDQQGAAWLAPGLLRLSLPLVARPKTRKDWAWHLLRVEITGSRATRFASWEWRKPGLRLSKQGPLRLLLPVEREAPPLPETTQRALGLDWGVRRLLTGTVCWLDSDVVRSDGRPLFFDAAGAQRNLERTRAHGQRLNDKLAAIERLLEGREDDTLRARRDRLQAEADRQWSHVRELNSQLAVAAANWAVNQASARGCDTIIIEDLATLEGRRLGKSNAKVSQQIRGQLFERLALACAERGIRLVVVPARGTSSFCSRCGGKARHQQRPDKTDGHANWLACACGRSSDRDHSAAERISSRGLNAATLPVRITRTRKPKALPALVFSTPDKSITGSRPRGERPSPRSVHRAPKPGPRSTSEATAVVSRANARLKDGQLDGFRHQIRYSRLPAHAVKTRPPEASIYNKTQETSER